jgi:uncharacterized tellurite resistance protein B-like protein
MIGFFEHQYLSYKKNHLYKLIELARADGNFHDDEKMLIYKIGERYGLKDRQIASMISAKKSTGVHIPGTHEGKMNQLHDLLLMVHADGVVDGIEISFCEGMAEQFGLKKEIVKWMLQFFKGEKRPGIEEWGNIIEASRKFIMN